MTEKFVPAPYLLDAPQQLITLYPNRTGHVYFENHKKPSLVIEKRDSITGDLLQGAKFQVWYASNGTSTGELNSLGTYFTDENGRIELSALRDGWYKVTELEPPQGYAIKDPATQECYIKGGEGKLLTFKNTPLNALVIKKVSATTGEVLQGAKFRLNYLSGVSGTGGTTIGEYTTSAQGTIVVTGLKAGTYVVTEIQAPAGYILDDAPKTVYLAGNAQDVVTVEFADQPNSGLTIAKLDGRTGEPLAGAVFEVKSSAGGVVGSENGRYTTDQSGLIHFPDLPSDSYVITELTAPAGYVQNATPQTVKLVHGETHLVKFYNYPEGGLLITKLDSVTLRPLSGVKFEVKDSAGAVVGDTNGIFKTDSRGTIHVPNLTPGTYVVREVETLDGYQLDTTAQSIKINDSRLYTLEFLNVPNGGLTVSKLDSQTKAPLSGAIFEVRDSKGAPVGGSNGQYTTDASGTINLPNLPADTYTVKEIQAPEGYTLDGTPQSVKLPGGKTEKLIFYNEAKGGLLVKKLDSITKEPLSGVKFEVTTSDGAKVGPANGIFVTDSQGSFLIPNLAPGSYVVRETEAIVKNLTNYFQRKKDAPSVSAFVQQRQKLLPGALEDLFHRFTAFIQPQKKFRGFRLLAVDGSSLKSGAYPGDLGSYHPGTEHQSGWNLHHVNALYDLENEIYTDIVVQKEHEKNEQRALCEMVDRSPISGPVLVLADRNYEAYNILVHLEERGWNYVIRLRDKGRVSVAGVKLPEEPVFDLSIRLTLGRLSKRQLEKRGICVPEPYYRVSNSVTFDFLAPDSDGFYTLSFRVVRLQIGDSLTETLLTNLDGAQFPPAELKQLYARRWGIETSFRGLKYAVGMVYLHSKKPDLVL